MNEIDAFMDALNPDIEVIWGVSDDNTLEDDAKVTILATGFDDEFGSKQYYDENRTHEDEYYSALIAKLYKPLKKDNWTFVGQAKTAVAEPAAEVQPTPAPEPKPAPIMEIEIAPDPEPEVRTENAHQHKPTWGKSLLGRLKQRLEDMGLIEDMNNPTE